MGQHAVVWGGYFGKRSAAIKLIIPSLAADPDVAVTSLQQEIAAYRALEKLQGVKSRVLHYHQLTLVTIS